MFKAKWQGALQTRGAPREAGSLIDSDVFFESVLKILIHHDDPSSSAWQHTLINTGALKKKRQTKITQENKNYSSHV